MSSVSPYLQQSVSSSSRTNDIENIHNEDKSGARSAQAIGQPPGNPVMYPGFNRHNHLLPVQKLQVGGFSYPPNINTNVSLLHFNGLHVPHPMMVPNNRLFTSHPPNLTNNSSAIKNTPSESGHAAAISTAAVVTPVKQSPNCNFSKSVSNTVKNNLTQSDTVDSSASNGNVAFDRVASVQEQNLLEELMELPQHSREQVFVVAVRLQRRCVQDPWGLGFANVAKGYQRVFLSKVQLGWNVMTYWIYVVPAQQRNHPLLQNNAVYTKKPINYDGISNHSNKSSYQSKLLNVAINGDNAAAIEGERTNFCQKHRKICPGDLVVAIDGHSISEFGSMEALTSYLKSAPSVCIVLARYPPATAGVGCLSCSSFFELAIRANKIWNDILPSSSSLLLATAQSAHAKNQPSGAKMKKVSPPSPQVEMVRNPWFRLEGGGVENIPYDDNFNDYSREDGALAESFLRPIGNFHDWISRRKTAWRARYNVYKHKNGNKILNGKRKFSTNRIRSINDDYNNRESSSVPIEFWSRQGFSSFDDWMASRVVQWKLSYSWNKQKRNLIQQECEEVVHLSSSFPSPTEFHHWLHVRRRQWALLRRKRQRLMANAKLEKSDSDEQASSAPTCKDSPLVGSPLKLECGATTESNIDGTSRAKVMLLSSDDKEMAFIDEILEAEERKRLKRSQRTPVDISKLFDSTNGIPDDIIVHCIEYLERCEHQKLLVIDRKTSKSLKDRQNVWKSLCPSHWILPRRPRKPWHELYFIRLKSEREQRQKRWDDLLLKCASALDSGDLLHKIEKLVEKAEKNFGFDVNYVSGVVCERNGLLNLAVIHRRHKVVRWLVDEKSADIETCDRGNFTPLLNAAFSGDKVLVRFFLQKGSNRNTRGTQHYSQGIAPPNFEGRTADRWAEERGFPDVAELIRLGL